MAESLVLAPLVKEDGRTRSETFWRLFKRVGPCVRSFVLEVNLDTILSFIWLRSAKDVSGWGVLIYKSVSDPNVTIFQPRDMNFRGKTSFIKSNFFIVRFACLKNFSFNFLVFLKETEKKTKEIIETVFVVCKTNEEKFWPSKSGFAHDIHISWLY